MIREANKFDLPYFRSVIDTVHLMDHTSLVHDMELDDDHLSTVMNVSIIGGGVNLIAEREGEPVGIIMGLIMPNMWVPKAFFLNQVLFYVDPEYRHTRVAHSLFTEYNERADELIEQKRILSHIMTASEPLFEVDFERFGFKLTEKIWTLEV